MYLVRFDVFPESILVESVCVGYAIVPDEWVRQGQNLTSVTRVCEGFWVAVENTRRKKGNVLFNDALNTFCLRLYGVGHMVKDHSDNEKGNLLPPHGLLFPISSKGSFICTISQT